MGSRYATLSAQQAKLIGLFQRAGYAGELPLFLTSHGPGADHPLLSWMADNLTIEDNYMGQADADAARQALADARERQQRELQLRHQSKGLDGAADDPLLSQFEDVAQVADQGRGTHGRAQHAATDVASVGASDASRGWLETETREDSDARLQELSEERAMYKAQIHELAMLEAQLDEAQRSSRAQIAEDSAAKDAAQASTNSIAETLTCLNIQLNAALSDLDSKLIELSELLRGMADNWLLIVKSPAKDAYMQTSGQLMDALLQRNLQHGEPGRIAIGRSIGLSSRPCTDSVPEDDADWIDKNDPFSPHGVSEDHLQDGLSNGEVEHMLRELARLSEARTRVAGDLPPASTSSSAENHGRASSLQALSRSTETDMHDIVRQDEAEVLQAHYDLQYRVLARQIERRTELLAVLLRQSARHLILHALQESERRELQALWDAVQSIDSILQAVVSAANKRCALYATSHAAMPQVQHGQLQADSATVPLGAGKLFGCGVINRLQSILAHGTNRTSNANTTSTSLVSGGSQCENAVGLLSPLQQRWSMTMKSVSDMLQQHLPSLLQQSRNATQESHALLFQQPGADAGMQPIATREAALPKIILHPQELGERLHELRMAACGMNELINDAVAENEQLCVAMADSKDMAKVERSVLEWFYLEPHKLSEYLANVEQQLAVMEMEV